MASLKKDFAYGADGERVYFYDGAAVFITNGKGWSPGIVVGKGRKFVCVQYESTNGRTHIVKRLPSQLKQRSLKK